MNPFERAASLITAPKATKQAVAGGVLIPSWKSDQPMYKDWSTANAIKDGFKASVWVYACVYRLMKDAASVPWIAEEKKGKEWEPNEDHPLTLLMEDPNPFMSRQDLIERLTSHVYLGGNGLWWHIMAGRPKTVVELWPIHPGGVTPVPSQTKFISRYEYDKDGVKKDFLPEDVTHFMFTDPNKPYWGMSPLQAAARTVDTDVEAVRWNKLVLQNRAVADVAFSFPQPLTREQWEQARETVREQYQGADNARTPWVLGSGAKPEKLSFSPVELDWLESRKDARREICAAFNVHPPIVGIYEDATLANIATARKLHWEDTIIPLLEDYKMGLNRSLVPKFGRRDRLRLVYDTTEVKALQRNFDELVQIGERLFKMGVPLNQIIQRLELQLKPVDGGDVGYIPSTLVPAGILSEPEPEPEPEE